MQYNSSSQSKFNTTNYLVDHLKQIFNTQLEKNILESLYQHCPAEKIDEYELQDYQEIAERVIKFIEFRKNDELKVASFHSINGVNKKTHFLLAMSDMPFIVDSVEGMFLTRNIDIINILHPTLCVERDLNGKMLQCDTNCSLSLNKESIVCLTVEYIDDNEQIQQIISLLKETINHVSNAVADWKNIVNQLEEAKGQIDKLNIDAEEKEELDSLLTKLSNKYFVFLGYINFTFNDGKYNIDENSKLGVIKSDATIVDELINYVNNDDYDNSNISNFISISKINKKSMVHRNVIYDLICIKSFDESGNLAGIKLFLGLFTSILYYQSATLIPVIRKKLAVAIKKSNFIHNSHGAKELISIAESLPRDELFSISSQEMYDLIMDIFLLTKTPKIKFYIRNNEKNKSASCLLFMPLDRVNSKTTSIIVKIIKLHLGEIINHNFVNINSSKLCYFHLMVKNVNNKYNIDAIEQEIDQSTLLFQDALESIIKKNILNNSSYFCKKYLDVFPESYIEKNHQPDEILFDIESLEKITEKNNISFKLYSLNSNSNIIFKVYSLNQVPLYKIIPIIQKLGFKVLSEHVYQIQGERIKKIWMNHFILTSKRSDISEFESVKKKIEDAFFAIWYKKAPDDGLNNLILKSNITFRQVSFIRSFTRYLSQINFVYGADYISSVLIKNSDFVSQLIQYFYTKFEPNYSEQNREEDVEVLKEKINDSLKNIQDPLEDKVLSTIFEVIRAIVRTNYFVEDDLGKFKEFISYKINSSKISIMPKPIPYMEIFVYSPFFEAVHIRSAKVSRGGLRWSDRYEDYRNEVLELVKAQIPKNAVIVPGGAKGGFVVRRPEGVSNQEYYDIGVSSYKNFLRGLLDITDNNLKDTIVKPKNVVTYDDDDPYLVVAADKGTATFSDIANSISQEYNFWLGDAFASGGSVGYDHKKMGITAKGAWISVIRHLNELNINPDKDEFTVVGIGDMSGDVFGNGMLLSNKIKLIAAFNHIHIFVDPNPDPEKSFKERKRLFDLPRSTWEDYNAEIISRGGRVFSRKAKMIEVSPEIKLLFNLKHVVLTPEELIKHILTANVDLLWNGGIGTYVKSSLETHAQVGDKTNDLLRVNGNDLKCKIIGEGGNLGFTQLGRIEFAKNGGRVNKDSIDNSAGVDCSDHEVNIKLLLTRAIENKRISASERDILLDKMTADVEDLVLQDNWLQTLALSITNSCSHELIPFQEKLVTILEKEGILDRKLEFLPSKEGFKHLDSAKQGLTRPELSILLAYSKLSIYKKVMNSNLINDSYFDDELVKYFPKILQEKFAEDIQHHPLRSEIIATSITNSVVNRVTTFFTHLTAEESGHKYCDIIRAYIITREVFNIPFFWNEIELYRCKVDSNELVKLHLCIKKFVMRGSEWLLRNSCDNLDLDKTINTYKDAVSNLYKIIDKFFNNKQTQMYKQTIDDLTKIGIETDFAQSIAKLRPMNSAFDIVMISNNTNLKIDQVMQLYCEIGNVLNFDWLKHASEDVAVDSNWQRLSIRGFKDELHDIQRNIAMLIIEDQECSLNVNKWLEKKSKHVDRYNKLIEEFIDLDQIEFAMLDLAMKRLKAILL